MHNPGFTFCTKFTPLDFSRYIKDIFLFTDNNNKLNLSRQSNIDELAFDVLMYNKITDQPGDVAQW